MPPYKSAESNAPLLWPLSHPPPIDHIKVPSNIVPIHSSSVTPLALQLWHQQNNHHPPPPPTTTIGRSHQIIIANKLPSRTLTLWSRFLDASTSLYRRIVRGKWRAGTFQLKMQMLLSLLLVLLQTCGCADRYLDGYLNCPI